MMKCLCMLCCEFEHALCPYIRLLWYFSYDVPNDLWKLARQVYVLIGVLQTCLISLIYTIYLNIYEMHIVIFGSTYLFFLCLQPLRCVERMWVGPGLHKGANLKKNSQKLWRRPCGRYVSLLNISDTIKSSVRFPTEDRWFLCALDPILVWLTTLWLSRCCP